MNERETKMLCAGLCVFGAVYLGFNALILVPTTLNQYNLGTTFNYGVNSYNLGSVGNATMTSGALTLSTYSGLSLGTVLPMIIVGIIGLALLLFFAGRGMLKGAYSS